jgi:hypothetical protein
VEIRLPDESQIEQQPAERGRQLQKQYGWNQLLSLQKELLMPGAFKLFHALIMVLTDHYPMRVDGAFCHVRFDKAGIIDLAALLYRAGGTRKIALNVTEGQHRRDPWPGGEPGVIFDGMTGVDSRVLCSRGSA